MKYQFSKLAIIILNWNGLENTKECLDSLKKSSADFKIFLVDNGSKNNEGEILKKEYGDFVTLIQNDKNLGFAQGNNIGIEYALKDSEIKYVLTLNNDTTVEPNFIEEALEKFSDPKIGMVAPKTMNYYQRNKIDNLGIQFTKGGLSFNIKSVEATVQNIFCPCGAAAFYSRELLEILMKEDGCYFDPDFFAYAEDLDLGFRARLKGFKCVLTADSIVYHKVSASTKIMSNLAVYYTYRNIMWVLTKNLPAPLFLRYLPKIIMGQIAIILLWIMRGKPLLIFRAYFNALIGLPKMLRKRKLIQKNKKISIRDLNKYFISKIFVKEYLNFKILNSLKFKRPFKNSDH